MGNIITKRFSRKTEHAELLRHIEILNTENSQQKDEIMKLKMHYKIQNNKLIQYIQDIQSIENCIHSALGHIPELN